MGDLKVWLAIGLGAIVLSAIVYSHFLYRAICRDEVLDALDEDAKADPAGPREKSLRGQS